MCAGMREENLPAIKRRVKNTHLEKSELNATKAIDLEAETLILETLQFKFAKLPGVKAYTVFSEELGIQTFPTGASEADADLVVFVDPIDGTEFAETLQAGWSLLAVYDQTTAAKIKAIKTQAAHPNGNHCRCGCPVNFFQFFQISAQCFQFLASTYIRHFGGRSAFNGSRGFR